MSIIIGFVSGFFGSNGTQAISYLILGSGIIAEFIAGVFFYLYNRTVLQIKEYYDSLLNIQNILLSFKIVNDTQSESEKAKMASDMWAYLIPMKLKDSSAEEAPL
jgi:hypothetical protein